MTDAELSAWEAYTASMMSSVGAIMHPAVDSEEAIAYRVAEIARYADAMLEERRKRVGRQR